MTERREERPELHGDGHPDRRVDRLLDALAEHRSWELRHIGRPAGTAPGFLTAFNRLLLAMAASARAGRPAATSPVAYVYKDSVLDLNADRVESIAHERARRVGGSARTGATL